MQSGRMLDAWRLAEGTGIALEKWQPGEARRVAAMLASSLGANRLSLALDWLNWRADRQDPEYFLHGLFSRMRFTPEIKLIPEIADFLTANPTLPGGKRADLLAFQGYLLASFRDFGPAFDCVGQALDLAPEESWIHVEHAAVLEIADRYGEALEAADRAIALRPNYRAAVLQRTDILVHLGRDEEAIAMLEEVDRTTQNPAFSGRLQSFHSEREDHKKGLDCLARFEERSPLADKSLREWIAGRRADFLYMAEDIDGYLEWADRAGKGFQKTVAERLRADGARAKSRVRLRVPFIRQHSMTCAPATLAALSSYWGKNHDHLTIADAICHDGTPWHMERKWAEENGFVAREFRVDDESSRELLDRGIPFTLTTQAATSAHLQACIGYDARTGILILRDPTHRHFGEVILSGLVKEHPFAGPRGMVIIPREESEKLNGLRLPDEAAYDAYHELLIALDTNDRFKIEGARTLLRTVAPNHPLVLEGEERFAIWRGDWVAQLAAVNSSLAIAPEHQACLVQKAGALRRLGRWHELRAFLREQASKPNSDPVFTSELGELLMEDARHLAEAERHLWKAMRRSRREARVFESMGRCLSTQNRHAEAARFRRVSASLAGSFEPYSRGYFDACRALRKIDDGLGFLRERVTRMGKKSAGPWLTLAEALNAIERPDEAAQVLSEAVAARPDDGDLMLSAGEMMTGWGGAHRENGLTLIAASRGRVAELQWLSATARTSAYLGDQATAIRSWRALLREQPQSTAAWRGLVRNVAEQDGEEEAIRLLDEATAKYPDDASLWILKAEWLADTKRGPLEALDRAMELNPDDNWVIRERAIRRLHAGDKEGAEADARHAVLLNPWSPQAFWTLGSVLEDAGKTAEAASAFRESIRIGVDFTPSSWRLVNISADRAEKLAAIAFIEAEMHRQVSNGEILLTYQAIAWSLIDPPELLDRLQNFSMERPDLWQTWGARVEQALHMRFDEGALLAAEELTTRFPLLPRGWLDLGRVHRAAGRHDEEEKAVARAGEISPGWDEAARAHAAVLERLGKHEEAISVLRRACRLDPLNGPNYGELADALRRNGRKDEAYEILSESMRLAPFYGWAWITTASWAANDGTQERMANLLRDAEEKHGHHRRWHGIATEAWGSLGNKDEALASIRRGLALSPADPSLRDSLALYYAGEKEFGKALEACQPVGSETVAPVNLRGRHAWILMHSGQPLKGVAEMKALVESEPDYAWGFQELAEWHYYRGESKELRNLCTRWLRASPTDSRVLGYLGMAELALDNTAAAKSAFARAHATDPENIHTARQLMDLQMKDREFDKAEKTLERLHHYASGPYITCDAIELALKKGDTGGALEIAGQLLTDPLADEAVFGAVAEIFGTNGARSKWNNLLVERMQSSIWPAPGSLVAFLRTFPESNLRKAEKKWVKREKEGSPARVAAWAFLIENAGAQRNTEMLRKLRDRNGAEFRANVRLWNALGQAFLESDANKDGVEWYSDWKERTSDMDAGSYLNLAALHTSCPGDDSFHWKAAGEVYREGLRRFPDSNCSQSLRAGRALHLAVAGESEKARGLLADFDSTGLSEYYGAIGTTAQAVQAANEDDAESAKRDIVSAMVFFSKYNDAGCTRIRKYAETAVAGAFAEFKGKIPRLRKKWYPGLPAPSSRIFGFFEDAGAGKWAILFVIFLIIRGCMAAVDN